MSATLDTGWQAEAARLRREERMATAEIAERVGRSASQVRRVLATANTDRAMNGASNGNGHATVDAETAERIRAAAETGEIPGQTTVDEHLAGFKYEAGEAVGPMPSRAVDAQDGLFDHVWEDDALLTALEKREKTREVKLSATKAHKTQDDVVKALLGEHPLGVGEVARIGRFRIKKTRRDGNEVSFSTEPREQLSIAVDNEL